MDAHCHNHECHPVTPMHAESAAPSFLGQPSIVGLPCQPKCQDCAWSRPKKTKFRAAGSPLRCMRTGPAIASGEDGGWFWPLVSCDDFCAFFHPRPAGWAK